MTGKKISLLHTDLPETPLIVRIVDKRSRGKGPPGKIQPTTKENNAALSDSHEPISQTRKTKSSARQKSLDGYLERASPERVATLEHVLEQKREGRIENIARLTNRSFSAQTLTTPPYSYGIAQRKKEDAGNVENGGERLGTHRKYTENV